MLEADGEAEGLRKKQLVVQAEIFHINKIAIQNDVEYVLQKRHELLYKYENEMIETD